MQSTGTSVTAMTVAASTANVFVKASGMEQLALLSGQREHRDEGQQDDGHGEEDGPADEPRRLEHGLPDHVDGRADRPGAVRGSGRRSR